MIAINLERLIQFNPLLRGRVGEAIVELLASIIRVPIIKGAKTCSPPRTYGNTLKGLIVKIARN